jgi:replicative superfamily II helicase
MATFATFIGIDRHAASDIRDLTGARRDATALHCLIRDSMPDAEATLLCDEQATAANIRSAITGSLVAAAPGDTVILSFAGHGTRDHRIVAHDTRRDALHATTIPMSELAEAFRHSKARAILCILDCCFSGGAPARVLEDSPTARDPANPLDELVGTGRVLFAAANVNELAYEHPTARHGLLTKAIIDVLTATTEPLSVGVALDRILDRIRADAGQLGLVQTPYLVSRVEGGLLLPPLTRGESYRAAFPERAGVTVGTDIGGLAAFGLAPAVIATWSDRFRHGLNELQRRAVNEGRALDGASLLVVAPTSSGKTFIGEMAAARAVAEHRRAVFLLPYKALVNEKHDQFRSLYGDRLGYRVIRCTGDYSDDNGALTHGKYEIAILTYEMFLNLALHVPAMLHCIGLVVLDEAQFVTDPNRGMTVELLLTYLLASRRHGIRPQLLALSAVIGDINDFDAWLGCGRLVSQERPVPLLEGVLDRAGTFQYLDSDGTEKTQQLLPPGAVRQRGQKASAQDVIVPLARRLIGEGEKIIVFRNQRGSAQGCANYLAEELALPGADDALAALPTADPSTASAVLRTCLARGTAFHTSNLHREEREVVERAFRDPDGRVRALAATTTVAAGINTPADTVIIAEQEFKGEEGRPFTVAEYKNMAGRAGRLGLRDQGRSIIYAETALQRQQLFYRYVRAMPEPIRSSFDEAHLDTWILRLLAQVGDVARLDVIGLLGNCYGGYLANRRNPKWQADTAARLEELLGRMISLGLVEEELGLVRLTLLGRACGQSTLSFFSAMRLVEFVRLLGSVTLTAERLVALLQGLPESDRVYTPMSNAKAKESVWPHEAATRHGREVIRLLQRFVQDEDAYLARCKRAAVLWDWMRGDAVEAIEQRYSTNPYFGRVGYGDVRQFADTTRFHLRSARQIVALLLTGAPDLEAQIDRVLRQLELGIPADMLDLVELPVTLERGQYLALRDAGARTRTELWALPQDDLRHILGDAVAERLNRSRPGAST